MIDQRELGVRLAALGDRLALDDDRTDGLADAVLDRLDTDRLDADRLDAGREGDAAARGQGGRWWAAAAVVVVCAGAVVAVPDARQAVARWLGLDGVEIEIDPDLSLPPPTDRFGEPGPGESRIVVVDGREIVVSAIVGAFDDILIRKTVAGSDQVVLTSVGGRSAVWVAGEMHEVTYLGPDGDVAVTRVAGNTLLWQDGDVLLRIEGFATLDAARAFADEMHATMHDG